MSTLPEPADIQAKLHALLALSKDFESYETFELEAFQEFIQAREQLLSEIQDLHARANPGELTISELIDQIQEVDERVAFRLERERNEQARSLRDMAKVKTVLGAYKFPIINTSTGVENQG